MSSPTEHVSSARGTAAYRWCLMAYPPQYRSEHGEDILATLEDAHARDSRLSAGECAALVVGGLRRRSADARSRGSASAVLSALRGAATILLLANASVEITGLVHRWTAPGHVVAIQQGPNGQGICAFMWVAVALSVVAVGLLGAGLRRWSGLRHWETPQGMRFTVSPEAKDELLDRLLELNHERYAAEVAAGLHEKKTKKATVKRKTLAADPAQDSLL